MPTRVRGHFHLRSGLSSVDAEHFPSHADAYAIRSQSAVVPRSAGKRGQELVLVVDADSGAVRKPVTQIGAGSNREEAALETAGLWIAGGLQPLPAQAKPSTEAESIPLPESIAGAEQVAGLLLALRAMPDQPVRIPLCTDPSIPVEIEEGCGADQFVRTIEDNIARAAPVRVVDGELASGQHLGLTARCGPGTLCKENCGNKRQNHKADEFLHVLISDNKAASATWWHCARFIKPAACERDALRVTFYRNPLCRSRPNMLRLTAAAEAESATERLPTAATGQSRQTAEASSSRQPAQHSPERPTVPGTAAACSTPG